MLLNAINYNSTNRNFAQVIFVNSNNDNNQKKHTDRIGHVDRCFMSVSKWALVWTNEKKIKEVCLLITPNQNGTHSFQVEKPKQNLSIETRANKNIYERNKENAITTERWLISIRLWCPLPPDFNLVFIRTQKIFPEFNEVDSVRPTIGNMHVSG